MTQEDLAALAQLDRPYLSLIEVGRKQPTLSVLYKLSLALGLGFGVFMGRVEQRYRNAPRSQKDH